MAQDLDLQVTIEEIGPHLFRFFCASLPFHVADDLVQETLLRLLGKIDDKKFDPRKGNLRMYAFGIAHFVRLEFLRENSQNYEALEDSIQQFENAHINENVESIFKCLLLGLALTTHAELVMRISENQHLLKLGLLSSAVAGGLAALTTIISKRLNDKGVNGTKIFQNRFIGLFLLALAWSLVHASWSAVTLDEVMLFMVLGVIGILVPMYCVNRAIETVGPKAYSFGISFSPGCL